MNKTNPPLTIRRLSEEDSLEDLTHLLHRSYKKLADMGLRFVATHQDVETTRRRASKGECYVAFLDGALVGTITFRPPGTATGTPHYEKPGVAMFGQYAVEPELQSRGIGKALLEFVESIARECGAEEIALDTSEKAEQLIAMYEHLGYSFVEYVQWPSVNYRSVVMSKSLR